MKMTFEIALSLLVPTPVWIVCAAICLVSVGLAIWRQLPGWWLRAAALAVLLAVLAQPAIRRESHESLTNVVFVIVDRTQSQLVGTREQQIEQGVEALRAKIGGLEKFEIRVIEVENDHGATDDGSMLMSALAKAASDLPMSRIAGAILVTDGQIHDAQVVQDFPAPVHVLLTGMAKDWDRRLVIVNTPAFAIVGEPVTLQFRIEDQGRVPAQAGRKARLQISVDGKSAGEFSVGVGAEYEIPLTLSHGGLNVLRINVPSEPGELTDRNNTAVLSINGVRDRLRVLLVSGEPHAGGRTWRNLLKSDTAVDLVHFTILRSPNKQDGVPGHELSLISFPVRELFVEKIDEFDLIIFDRYWRRGILPDEYLANVADYLRGGGAVLMASGPAFSGPNSIARTALNGVLPAKPTARIFEQGYVPRISGLGRRHPVTEDLETFAPNEAAEDGTPGWGRWFRLIQTEVKRGQTLMTGAGDQPLLILDRVGEGRIAMLMSDHIWLWSRGFEGGGPHLELLRRLAHWMMKEPELEEERISAVVEDKTVTVVRRSMKEGTGAILVTGPDNKVFELETTEVSPGRSVASFDGEENGLYRLSDGVLEAVVAIGPTAPREFEKTIADPILLEPIMTATRGGVLRLEDVGRPQIRSVREGSVAAGRGWLGVSARNAYQVTDIRQTPLLPGWVLLLLTAGLMVAAWRWEGR